MPKRAIKPWITKPCKWCAKPFLSSPSRPEHFCVMACKEAWHQDPANIIARFWSKVNKTEKCWLYTGAIDTEGYGRFSYGPAGRGRKNRKQFQAHRYSWLLAGGELPKMPKQLCHHCDVRHCVRPDHMYIGDHNSNAQDRVQRKRSHNQYHPLEVLHYPRTSRRGQMGKS